ncbi:MAG: tRNA pseudouridine(38-40) synthase TruA [Bacteroidetes bacterium]|nr:tRNA pseudouridine(38-40) synthase TruA [Bacteroidota bacterium]
MATYALLIEYDGAEYSGWQRQNFHPTIQSTIEESLRIFLRNDRLQITGAGRTDAGVHARGQVAHFRCEPIPQDLLKRLIHGLNGLLPKSIAIRAAVKTQNEFHARFDAIQRSYHYLISCEPFALQRTHRLLIRSDLDFERMNCAAQLLVGSQHFGAFCRTNSSTTNRICNITRALWEQEALPHHWTFIIDADRFLHGMVRSIVGTLLEIGQQKMPLETLQEIISQQDRRNAGHAAPPHALILDQVTYPTPLFQP